MTDPTLPRRLVAAGCPMVPGMRDANKGALFFGETNDHEHGCGSHNAVDDYGWFTSVDGLPDLSDRLTCWAAVEALREEMIAKGYALKWEVGAGEMAALWCDDVPSIAYDYWNKLALALVLAWERWAEVRDA